MRQQSQQRDKHQSQLSYGGVSKVSGPIIIGEGMLGAKVYDLVRIGSDKLMGQIIKLNGKFTYIQCFQDTSKLSIGDLIQNTNHPLSAALGPGLLEQMFDGFQRPLQRIAYYSQSTYIPLGVDMPSLDQKKLWFFEPKKIKQGQYIFQGDIFGIVEENSLFGDLSILLPPKCKGKVTYIAPPGQYNVNETVLEIERNQMKYIYSLSHKWPIRQPRPVLQKIYSESPLITGTRVLDSLFPLVLGGIGSMPGGSGCGRRTLMQGVFKHSNTDVNIFVGCSERGNEMAEILQQFPMFTTQKNGKQYSVMEKSCIVANTTNMSASTCQASIYTGITIAEFFRDMGKDVFMIADSTSRWAQTIKHISLSLGEIPGDGGYPSYMGNKLAGFYGRAGKAQLLGSPVRSGSITLIGTVSPSNGDYSDFMTTKTLQQTQTFWALDKRMAQIRHFPEVNWRISHSNYLKQLDSFFNLQNQGLSLMLKKIKSILDQESTICQDLEMVDKKSLTEDKKLNLSVASIIRNQLLQQNAFSNYDYYCPLQKTIGMIKCITTYYELAMRYISSQKGQIKFQYVKQQAYNQYNKLQNMKFIQPKQGKKQIIKYFEAFDNEIKSVFKQLMN